MVGEETPLTGNTVNVSNAAFSMSRSVGITIAVVQVVFAVLLSLFFGYADVGEYTVEKYIIFRDIMVMLLLGFGYLMTFLHLYGLGAVGLTMLLTVINMQCNILVEGFLSGDYLISMDSIINAEFSAATLLISFGALIGRATPFQMCVLAIAESVFLRCEQGYYCLWTYQR